MLQDATGTSELREDHGCKCLDIMSLEPQLDYAACMLASRRRIADGAYDEKAVSAHPTLHVMSVEVEPAHMLADA